MLCALVGIVPPREELWGTIRQQVTSVCGTAIEWRNSYSLAKDDDNDGAITLLMAAVVKEPVSPQDVVTAVEAVLSKECTSVSCELWASAPAPLPLRPTTSSGGYSAIELQNEEEGSSWQNRAAATMREWGIIMQQKVLSGERVNELRRIVDEAIANAEHALALHRPDIEVGHDTIHFKEIASRTLERFDLRLTSSVANEFVETVILGNPIVEEFLQNSLGGAIEDVVFDLSVVYSRPGATTQGWHSDGGHLTHASDAGWAEDGWNTCLSDAYAICLFVPLIDLNPTVGFTQFWPGSHRSRDLIGFGQAAEVTQSTFDAIGSAGDGVWYDYRLWHHGMPNESNVVRPVVQIIFKEKHGYVEKENYGTETINCSRPTTTN